MRIDGAGFKQESRKVIPGDIQGENRIETLVDSDLFFPDTRPALS
jgi:hypothetical protein